MTNLELVIPLLSSFILTLIFTPVLIKYAHQKHMGQMIREEGPQWHQKKAGTPTMGGFVFNFAILITCLWTPLVLHQMTPQILVLDFILMLYGFLGFWDDSIKLLKKQNEGLTARQKLFGQIIGAVVFLIVYCYCGLPFSL